MTADLTFFNQHVQLKIEQIIKRDKKAVWPYLSTSDGFKTWFSEINADDLISKNELLFDVSGIVDHLPILTFDAPNTLHFIWSDARVKFDLRDIGNNMCELVFTEIAPPTFPDLLRDMTGWTLKIANLKAVAENKPYTFDQKQFDQIEESYREQLNAHHFYE